MVTPQRFYPTSWAFHPSEGSTVQLFNHGVRRERVHATERPPDVCPAGARWVRPGCGSPCSGKLSCPVSAASPASAPAAARRPPAARGPPAARRAAPARRTAAAGVPPVVAPVVPAVVSPAPRRTGASATDPPAARAAVGGRRRGRPGRRGRRAVRPVPATAGPARREPGVPAPAGLARQDEHHHDHRQDDALDRAVTHGVTLLPFPRSGPPWAPRLVPRLARCPGDSRPSCAAKQS